MEDNKKDFFRVFQVIFPSFSWQETEGWRRKKKQWIENIEECQNEK